MVVNFLHYMIPQRCQFTNGVTGLPPSFACHGVNRHAWTAPIQFYARAVGASLDRVFWTYAKDAR